MGLHIDVSHIYPVDVQRAKVKNTLSANELIQEILNEFGDETENRPENYLIFRGDNQKPLAGKQALALQGVREGDTLIFTSLSEAQRQNLGHSFSAYLLLAGTNERFDIAWQPAIIGRPDPVNKSQNDLLAVNLDGFKNSLRVSRQHAQIKVKKGKYLLQSLAERNPTYLNGEQLEINRYYPLQPQDVIRIGYSQIELVFFRE